MCFSGLFSKPKTPDMPIPSTPPTPSPSPTFLPSDTDTGATASDAERKRRQMRAGLSSTIKTSSQGVLGAGTSLYN